MVQIILGGRVSVDFWNGLLRFWGHELRAEKRQKVLSVEGSRNFVAIMDWVTCVVKMI